jgi:hypothetical protein
MTGVFVERIGHALGYNTGGSRRNSLESSWRRWHDGAIMNARTQITMDPDLQRRAHAKADELGISFAEYVRRLVANDLGEPKRKVDVSILFDLIDEGPPTDIARDKDKMLGEAVWAEYLRKTGQTRRPGPRPGKSRR